MSTLRQLLRTGGLTVAWLAVLPCAVLVMTALVPIVPWLRLIAFDIVPNRAPWFLICALAGLAAALLAHRHRPTWPARALGAIAALASVGAAIVVGQLVVLAQASGASIDWLQTLSVRHLDEDAYPDDTYVYDRPGGEPLRLDVYRPPLAKRRAAGPLLMMIHGGGFVEGDRRMSAANMRSYAARGWTIVSIDYRLATATRPTWNLALRDVRCAIAWVGGHATMLGVDPGRIALNGASAGASLALAAAYTHAPPPAGCGTTMPRVVSVVARAPLIDPAGSWDHPGELQPVQRSYMSAYLGGSPRAVPAHYAAVDLRRLVAPGLPPTLIMAGTRDPLLPVATVRAFASDLEAKGNAVRFVAFPYAGHNFNATYGGIPNQTVRRLVARFLHDTYERR